MKNESIHGRTLAIMSTIINLMIGIITYAMYYVTGYYIYFFISITALFMSVTNLLLIALKWEDNRYKNPKPPKVKKAKKKKRKKKLEELLEEEAEEEEKTEEKPKRKKINFHKMVFPIYLITYIVVYYFCCTSIISYTKKVANTGKPLIANAILFLIILVVTTVLEKLCKYSTNNSKFVDAILQSSRATFRLLIVESVIAIASIIVEYFQLVNIQKYIGYLYTVLFFYYLVFVTISILVTIMRKELVVAPYIVIPIPFVKNQIGGREQGFLDYLEENTGITIRSLWSIKYIRKIAPTTILAIALLLWLSTCITQVNSQEQAVVYRLGKLQQQILEPGLHVTLPYPIDKVEIYNTGAINKVTIGYKATENADNVWTEGHEGEEYVLLMGGGDEVVSINLRLEYKISDLNRYLTTATAPESVMQALAYELVTDKTVATDLATLMSADRDAFSEEFKKELSIKMEEQGVGLEIVAVVLESIHPPLQIAWVYQELISAEIKAEKYIINAEDVAAVTLAEAETTYDTTVGTADVDYHKNVATAKASVAEFMASLEAYNTYSDSYRYYKYLAAVKKAYGNANLVILGEGVDASALYFGSFYKNSEQ